MCRSRRFSFMLMAVLCACAVAGPGVATAALNATVAPNPSMVTATGTTGLRIADGTTMINCTTDGFTATLASAVGGAPLPISRNVAWSAGGCTVPGRVPVALTCTNIENFTVDGVTSAAGVTPGSVGFDCIASLGAACSVQIVGVFVQTYDNTSVVTAFVNGQTIVAQNSSNGRGAACATLPNSAPAPVTNPTGANLVFRVAAATTVRVV
jgi:hypothetical protein